MNDSDGNSCRGQPQMPLERDFIADAFIMQKTDRGSAKQKYES